MIPESNKIDLKFPNKLDGIMDQAKKVKCSYCKTMKLDTREEIAITICYNNKRPTPICKPCFFINGKADEMIKFCENEILNADDTDIEITQIRELLKDMKRLKAEEEEFLKNQDSKKDLIKMIDTYKKNDLQMIELLNSFKKNWNIKNNKLSEGANPNWLLQHLLNASSVNHHQSTLMQEIIELHLKSKTNDKDNISFIKFIDEVIPALTCTSGQLRILLNELIKTSDKEHSLNEEVLQGIES